MALSFDILSSLDSFFEVSDRIESDLSKYTDSFFYSPLWLIPFQQVLVEEGRVVHIIGRNDDGGLIGSMHLATVKTPFLKIFKPEVVAILGTRSVVSPEHLEFAIDYEAREAWCSFFENYFRQNLGFCSLAIFDSVAEEAKNVEALTRYLSRKGYHVIKQAQDRCPYLDLPDTFEDLLASYSSKKRKSIRRDLRNNETAFDFVDYRTIGDIDKALEAARQLHNRSRNIKDETGSFDRKGYMEFHRLLARRLAEVEKLYFKFLVKDGKPVAFLYGFLDGDRFYDYQTGYDTAFAAKRPGFLILARVIQDLISLNVKRFDFLRGYEPYKLYWTDTVRNTYRYYILPPGLKSWVYYVLLKIYRGWR